ncbi:MAG: hypothetical protein ABI890_09220 [Lapillicoccus sp.]
MTVKEDVAVGFIIRNLMDGGLVALWEDEKFRTFRDLVADRKTIAAAKEYQSVTGADLPECHLAVKLVVAFEEATSAT